ncbi:mitochondrial fission 1 protein A-like protein [Carex littledalei]|uniref:Mitochondrial fission 1 protein n=1 Tax=Carex littledalei TaxID=544730 RepID=A0A833QWC9_9POAL|nr:mitochondrial fission 1 protein A-like protein [Carex littledalei]
MEGVGKFFDSVGSIFKGGDNLPWCDPDIIAGCEREVAEAGNEEQKNESLMRLAWALVHSRQPDDVNRGIGMLEASLENSNSPLQTREKIYLLAVGSYRTANYSKSRHLLDRCLEVAPDWRQAQNLSKLVDDQVSRDGMIGMGIVAGAFGVGGLAIAGIVAAATSATRKSTEKK